jgi:predicted nucleic acid-binding protein
MILIDTSIWVNHLRKGHDLLSLLLEQNLVLTHPFVIGELACGSMSNRHEILQLLETLPGIGIAHHAEVLHLIEAEHLYGQGIGWVDAHLLASTLLADSLLYTTDKKLRRVTKSLGIAFEEAGAETNVYPRKR